MIKEVVFGAVVGVFLFLLWVGYNILPVFLLVGLGIVCYVLLTQKGLLGLTNTNRYVPGHIVTFSDIGGQEPAKNELKEALEFIIKADKIKKMGIRPLRGILLSGPPGTGKTLLAKAAAAYTDSIFLAASGSEFIEMYAGVGAQRVRNLFKKARDQAQHEQKTSAIVFIDEIEVLAGKRGMHGSSHLEYDQTLNQLLVEMDGIRSDDRVRVLVIGATNRSDLLDSALLRPGRFDRVVKVDLPDKKGREEILNIHVNNKPLDDDVDLETLAGETFGFSGAHLESVANEGAILALRENCGKLCQRHFREAVDKVMMGEKLNHQPTEEEMYRIAVHESGHALVSEVLIPDSVSHVTITSRGNALGYTRHNPKDDPYLYTKDYLENQIKVFLAGSVAEEMVIGNKSTGAANDFKQAVRVAKQIVLSGLSRLGVVSEEDISNSMMHRIISEIVRSEEKRVCELLKSNLAVLEKIVQFLQRNESLGGDELRELMLGCACA